MSPPNNPSPLLDIRAVQDRLGGVHKSTIYRLIDDGLLPEPVRLGKRLSRWRQSELDKAIAELPRGRGAAP
jgi:excisionase family DNA binding protein